MSPAQCSLLPGIWIPCVTLWFLLGVDEIFH